MKPIILISFATLLTSVLFGQMTPEAYLNLVTDGLGESLPLGSNDTPVNKALNRRVEFIKL
jgi:outer membrane protein OmpA-like peptidoglycan-associated protein